MPDTFKVPMYLKAPNADGLVREMLKHNLKVGYMVKYFDIGKQGKSWFAWFLGDANHLVKNKIEKATGIGNGASQDN